MEWQWKIIKKDAENILIRLMDIKTNQFVKWQDIKENYTNKIFIESLIKLLSTFNSFSEFYIEFNPVKFNLIHNTVFEFVLIKTSGFSTIADMESFGIEKLNTNSNQIIWFQNPSNTALLIVPSYNHSYPIDDYIHIGKFIRSSNIKQKYNLIFTMFELYFSLLEKKPNDKLWLSTHGKGVAWLHIRIDKIPKYISWKSYK